VLPALERRHDVLAPTLAGHAGGPQAAEPVGTELLLTELERAMDDVGWETAHIVGNSLGGYLAMHLAARGRARSVVALAPAGGWAVGDDSFRESRAYFLRMHEQVQAVAPHADAIAATEQGRRRATEMISERYEHIPAELVAHQIVGVAACSAVGSLVDEGLRVGWSLDAERIACPVRVVWGTADRILEWPSAAERYRREWAANADWVVLDGVGHCPQLDIPIETAQLVLDFTSG
jgi:pimeloyl-ACP methyl ester carboxylesterase